MVLDGAADESCGVLNGRTPLEFAKTPNLDGLASMSRSYHCFTVKEGAAPQSSDAMVSLFGNDPKFFPRGPLEAVGSGIKLVRGDLALRCNFATIEDLETRNILDRRAGRTLTTKEAKILARVVNEKVKLPFKFEFRATNQHRGVLVFKGGFSDNISSVDPHYNDFGAGRGSDKFSFSQSLDDEEDSKLSAELLNNFVKKSHEVLDKHPLNLLRAKKGLFSANFILCRGAGNQPPVFKKLKGKWMGLGYMPLEIGLARAAKMDIYRFNYPKMKGMDVYANLYAGLKKAIKYAIKMMWKNRDKYDYFYVHFKETDIPGHDNKPMDKVKMIEMIDYRFFSFLKEFAVKNNAKLLITSDHTTSCRMKAHAANPVPVLFYNPADNFRGNRRFTEEDGLKGKKVSGRKLLERTLFLK